MRRFKFAKLIRDKILTNMVEDSEQNPNYRNLNDDEYLLELKKKLIEEVEEMQKAADEDIVEEIADIYEILTHLTETLNISQEKLDTIIEEKHKKVGGFDDRVYLEYNDVDDESEWVDYYQNQPHKYPELPCE